VSTGERVLWRVFPWNPAAAEGEPFSAGFVPAGQGRGRFDLPGRPSGVVYLAETPEHAVAELIQRFRSQPAPLEQADLVVAGQTLALVAVTLSPAASAGVADLCDPELLARHGIRPDDTAARARPPSQRAAADLHAAGHAGLRWWSAFFGEWHSVVLFRDRLEPGALDYGAPAPLHLAHPALTEAALALDVPLR
jgi:hypothetical protein